VHEYSCGALGHRAGSLINSHAMNTEIDVSITDELNREPFPSCDVALKEWSVTCQALARGRQIALLRKGGLLDSEGGVFALEHGRFWLQPTYLHQEQHLVKPEHRDLFAASDAARTDAARTEGEGREWLVLQLFAQVENVWSLSLDDEDALTRAPHIWSRDYLDVRWNYKPQHPLLCVALRVYQTEPPHRLPMKTQWTGCRSWIEVGALSTTNARPVLDDVEWARQSDELQNALGAADGGA